MTAGTCKGLCDRFAIRLPNKSGVRRAGLLKIFANWIKEEKRCRTCECVYSKEQNLERCPCCGNILGVANMHGDKKKIATIVRY